jgi:GTP cyclohydrolase IIa
MVCLGAIHLKNYENWIKSLGYDREWLIQATQAEVYRYITMESAALGMFAIPLTYDVYLVILNSTVAYFNRLVKALEIKIPIEFNVYLGFGETYSAALNNLKPLGELDASVVNGVKEFNDITVVSHLDLNSYNNMLTGKGLQYVNELLTELVYTMKKTCMACGGVAHYAGGDNVICFIPHHLLSNYLSSVAIDDAKIGIGIAKKPRDALKLAAQALDLIRAGKCDKRICILRE